MNKKWICLLCAFLIGCLALSACGRKSTEETIQKATEQINEAVYTVIFQDRSGKVLDTQTVSAGQPAVAPESPEEEGYYFVGWDRDFSCITADTVVNALYSQTALPSFMILQMKARPGENVTVPVVIVKNPGIAGAKLTLNYDPSLTLTAAQSAEAFSTLDYTGPGKLMSPCSFTWDSESGMAKENGQVLMLTFQIPEDAVSGQTYAINGICKDGDIYDEALEDVSLGVINGFITVE